ncbi:translocation/assembly module TamB [Oryzomonas sagensis]|uniref:Translocation/assembly module TamB n=1 Tax=Oryzomonas sagensis TaxID=2603857 RepID=A0ABQ6TLD8_9BACT|nr:translocation/assembly module TamB domain-containing protein [Oryzomonas sagensis]KAB0669084.1 translocation/assembly module TamB [Oryzomonas sagensis]
MKRPPPKSLVAAVAIALAGAALAALVWIVSTTQGARWLLGAIDSLSGGSFSVQKVEGRVADHLLLTGVRIALPQQKLEFGSLELGWKPLLLLSGTVAIQELAASGVRIQDNAPPAGKPPILAWPRAPQMAQQLDMIITRLQVTDLSYRRRQEQPVRVTSIAASVTWRDSLLAISDLTAVAPSGRISGAASAGFRQPSLTADLVIAPAHPVAEMDRFRLKVGRGNGRGPEPFTGTVAITGTAGARKLLELTGDVGMAPNAFNLRRLRLTKPGQKGVLTADGSLTFTARESALSLQVMAAGLDLSPQLNVPTNLSGTLRFAGTLDRYRGDVTLTNKGQGWRAASVSASYRGTRDGIKLAPLNGRFLDGSLAGNLDMNWRDGFAMQGVISGRNLNPARIAPDWKGRANFNATGTLAWPWKAPLSGSVSGVLLESRLHGQGLAGGVQADFAENNLNLSRLALQGKGFDLHASGELNRRLAVAARITDLSLLVPGAAGTLRADGWVRWRERHLSGAVAGTGSKLAWHGARAAAANLSARLEEGAGSPLHVAASLRDAVYDGYALGDVTLAADGTLPHHAVSATLHSAGSEARLNLAAGYGAGTWKGEITRFAGRDRSGPWNLTAPTAFAVSADKFALSPLSLTAGTAERLEVAADLAFHPLNGHVRAKWAGLNLVRVNPYLKDMQFTGNSSGTVRLGFLPGKRLTLAGSASGNGTFAGRGTSATILRSQVTFDGSEQGMRGSMDLTTASGGRLQGTFMSSAPLRLAMPEKGDLTAELSGIDLALLKPWLPRDTGLEGRITGRAKGSLMPGQRFELTGTAALSGGALHQTRPDGELNLICKSAEASWHWRGATLGGTLFLTMADHGQARADFHLPVPARFPVAVDPKGPLRASLTGQFQEKGIITALFPGLVQESSGELAAELAINGTWAIPQIGGMLKLAKAGAYLPTAGVRLKDVQFAARLEKNLIRIDSFRAVSGPGHVEGTVLLTLAGWRVVGYQGTITGENFQTVYFPELQLLSTPKLTFTGTPQKITLRGELRLPELRIVGAPSRTAIAPSSDVIVEGRGVPVAKASPLVLDVQVRVLLGDKVFVKVAGIDAQLGGALDLSLTRLDSITSRGEIKVVKGRYRTYGVNLEIVRGRLFFAGGPINRPSLDFLALRTIGDVRVGVTVAGTLQKPVTKLYSEPAMPDVDVLAYIVLGHPLGSSSQQAGLVAQAAGALLTSGQAGTLQEQIKNHLGLSTLEIQGGVGGTASPMGYKPLQVTPPGAIPATQQPGVTETMLTVGKYLTPQLYISYGKSLFTGSNLFLLRYDILKQWQIETQTGTESGADLFYKLEFK